MGLREKWLIASKLNSAEDIVADHCLEVKYSWKYFAIISNLVNNKY